MNKDEMINKILEMMKELYEIGKDELNEEELKQTYVRIKFCLETAKELKGDSNVSNSGLEG